VFISGIFRAVGNAPPARIVPDKGAANVSPPTQLDRARHSYQFMKRIYADEA